MAEQCFTCKGVGSLTCPNCQGKSVSVDDRPAQSCGRCKSTGKITCPTCLGQIPIPPE